MKGKANQEASTRIAAPGFGTLGFFGGVPGKASTEKPCHNLRLPAHRAGLRALLVNQTWRQCLKTRRKP